MKTKSILLVSILITAVFTTKATDLLVEEFGLAPAYSSIGAAVAAAVDGDRILIKNRTGNIPWVEDITIAKSIELLSYVNDSFFIVQGTYTITPASGREVTIIGMLNHSGGISAGTNGTGTRTEISIFDSHLLSGSLNFNYNALDVNIVGTKLNSGTILLKYGNVIGCDIVNASTSSGIYIGSDAAASNDYIRIIGNRVRCTYSVNSSTISAEGIEWLSTAQFMDIRNNFVQSEGIVIKVNNTKNSSAKINTIYNNTLKVNTGSVSSGYSIYNLWIAGVGSSAIIEVMNNLLDFAATASGPTWNGFYCATGNGQRNIYYNVIDNSSVLDNQISGSWTVNTNNIINTSVSVGSTGVPSGTVATDKGNPAQPFYDIDLTPNDAGCYGGSFTQDNYFPQFAGAAKIWYVDHPFNIRQGNTLSIQAESFDR